VRIAYARLKAMVTHRCGVWPDAVGGGNFENRDDWELGCATQSNLAAMVANPEDLVTPAGEDPADGTRRTTIITKYRAGTQTKAETGAKGTAIADGVQGGN
jgi:pilus assembly protein CpaD